jgi:hypothetical protein
MPSIVSHAVSGSSLARRYSGSAQHQRNFKALLNSLRGNYNRRAARILHFRCKPSLPEKS